MMENRDKGQPMTLSFFSGRGDAAPIPLPGTSGLNSDHWNQVLPQVMPWSTYNGMPQVVRFTGDDGCQPSPFAMMTNDRLMRFDDSMESKPKVSLPKRKYPIEPDLCPEPVKIHVTDEQMATRMKGLHISNDFTPEDLAMHQEDDLSGIGGGCGDKSLLPSLVVCDEIRQLQMPNNILPPELVARLERPSKALVLWKPPEERVAEIQRIALRSTKPSDTALQDDDSLDDTCVGLPYSSQKSAFVPFLNDHPIRSISFLSATNINNNNNNFRFLSPTDVEEMSLDM